MEVKVIRALDGYDHAFGTGKEIENGLKLTVLELENGYTYAKYNANKNHGGLPGVLHGGIITTLLDELSGSAGVVGSGHYCVTAQFNTTYIKPGSTTINSHVVAKVVKIDGKKVYINSALYNDDLEVLATGKALFIKKFTANFFDNDESLNIIKSSADVSSVLVPDSFILLDESEILK